MAHTDDRLGRDHALGSRHRPLPTVARQLDTEPAFKHLPLPTSTQPPPRLPQPPPATLPVRDASTPPTFRELPTIDRPNKATKALPSPYPRALEPSGSRPAPLPQPPTTRRREPTSVKKPIPLPTVGPSSDRGPKLLPTLHNLPEKPPTIPLPLPQRGQFESPCSVPEPRTLPQRIPIPHPTPQQFRTLPQPDLNSPLAPTNHRPLPTKQLAGRSPPPRGRKPLPAPKNEGRPRLDPPQLRQTRLVRPLPLQLSQHQTATEDAPAVPQRKEAQPTLTVPASRLIVQGVDRLILSRCIFSPHYPSLHASPPCRR